MSSDPIEGESSYLEPSPILSPSMSKTNICFEPISKIILNPNDPPHVLLPNTYNDPIINSGNPLRHPRHRSHEGHKSDQEEQ